jgi:quinol monooxygenase YgiN
MIDEYIRYRIDAGRSAAFLEAYTVAAEQLRASKNCLGYELSRCTEAPEHFILRIQWDSVEGHLQGFRKGPQFPSFLRAIQAYVNDIEEMRHYEPTAIRWAPARSETSGQQNV